MEAAEVRATWLVLIWLAIALPVIWWLFRHREWPSLGRLGGERQRHPGHPEDCRLCRQASEPAGSRDLALVAGWVEPWSARKSRRGRKKELETAGVACPNPGCAYVGIGDSTIHAIVGDGKRGVTDAIHPSTSLRIGTANAVVAVSAVAGERRCTA
jgi:hypothetical protein